MLIGLHERHALPVPRNAATPFNAVPREALNLVRRGEWLVSSEREHATTDCCWPILLKNSIAAATLSVVEKVDPLERSQSDANEAGDGLRPPKLPHEKRESSFSTE